MALSAPRPPSTETAARTPRTPRFAWYLALSFGLNVLLLAGLGLYFAALPSVPVPSAARVFRIAVLPKPPPPPVRPLPPPRPPRKIIQHRPRVLPKRANMNAPSVRPHPAMQAHSAPPAQGRAAGPRMPTPPSPHRPAPAPKPAAMRLVLAHDARLPTLRPLVPATVPVPDAVPASTPAPPATPSGGASGHGQGQGNAQGTGAGNGGGAGHGGGGGPFGIGSGGGEGLRHIVYVLDTSGSMGSRIDRARQEIREALAGLVPGETFDIITFSDDAHPFDSALDAATPEMVARASYFLSTIQIGGGTNLDSAMRRALSLPGVNVVCLVTDGDPTEDENGNDIDDKDRYFLHFTRRVRELNVGHARIYTIGLVGKDPLGHDQTFAGTRLLQQLSHDSGGVSKIVPLGIAVPD